jgi:hypothetical protein
MLSGGQSFPPVGAFVGMVRFTRKKTPITGLEPLERFLAGAAAPLGLQPSVRNETRRGRPRIARLVSGVPYATDVVEPCRKFRCLLHRWKDGKTILIHSTPDGQAKMASKR